MVALVAALIAVLVTLLSPVSGSTASAATETGRVRGAIVQPGGATPRVEVRWFTEDWTYLGARRVRGGAYSLSLRPGRYHLQFVDLRPAYDVTKSQPTDVTVTVRPDVTVRKNVRMRRGAAVGGTVRAGGKVAAGARVVAANADERSFETTADARGNFALGGLPEGSYSIFTYDRRGQRVARSTYLRRLTSGSYRNVRIRLDRRAGTLTVDLYTGSGDSTRDYRGVAFVTAVSRATGQFWTARASRGTVTFAGLYPGRYDLQVPGTGVWLGARVAVRASVRSGRVAFGAARLTRRGAWLSGTVVDPSSSRRPLVGATLRLYDASGTLLDTARSGSGGRFVLDGQLLTQSGLTVVAGPGPDSPFLGEEPNTCAYAQTRAEGLSVRTGRETTLGEIVLPYVAGQSRPTCQTPAPSPTPTPTPTPTPSPVP